MAGTLTISTLSDGTNSTSSTNCIQGSAKAFVSFYSASGAAAVISKSYNVSSCTLAAAGTWYINYTNSIASVNCVSGSTGAAASAPPNAQTTSNNSALRCLVVLSNNSTGTAIASAAANGSAPINDGFGVYNIIVL